MNLCEQIEYEMQVFESVSKTERNGKDVGKGIYIVFYSTHTDIKLNANVKNGITVAKIKKSFKKDSQKEVLELAREVFSKFDLSDFNSDMKIKEQPYYLDFNNAYKNFKSRLDEIVSNSLEKLGLGKAPFTFLGVMESPSKAIQEKNPEAYNNALADFPKYDAGGIGICARCYNTISAHYNVKSSDGKIFPLGSECISYINDSKLETEALKAKKKLDSKKRKDRDKRKVSSLDDILNDTESVELMKNKSYPLSDDYDTWNSDKQQWYLKNVVKGGSYYDWAISKYKQSGVAGKKRLLAKIVKELK